MRQGVSAAAAGGPEEPRRYLFGLIAVRRSEIAALAYAWLYIFSVLMSYYIMRPIRDEMGVAGGVKNLPWLFTGTLIAMLAVNAPYGALVRAMPRVRFISVTYRFFALNILLFAVAFVVRRQDADRVGRAGLLHLDLGLQPVRRVGVLGHDGRHVRLGAGEAPCSVSSPQARRSGALFGSFVRGGAGQARAADRPAGRGGRSARSGGDRRQASVGAGERDEPRRGGRRGRTGPAAASGPASPRRSPRLTSSTPRFF